MWRLETPKLEAAKHDVHVTVNHTKQLDAADEAKLVTLYEKYHKQGGRVTDEDLKPLESKKDVIRGMYPKSSGKATPRKNQTIGSDNPLVYMRNDLMRGVVRCPMCSILRVSDLDHVWPESDYGQLAVCRLNLVPTCGKCNNAKRRANPKEFIHSYYQQFPVNKVFLIASCKVVAGKIIARFVIDQQALHDDKLAHTLHRQMVNIHLRERLQKESQEFFMKLFRGAKVKTDAEVQVFLKERLEKYKKPEMYGLNDWRTAILRGLIACHAMDIKVVRSYQTAKARMKDVNI